MRVGLQVDSEYETSATIRGRTTLAREKQRARFGKKWLNGFVPFQLLDETCGLSKVQRDYIQQICFENKLSNRTQTKLIRIARTIADLEGTEYISENALQESIKWKLMAPKLHIFTRSVGE